ncbi:probable tubulin polyglutamylase ttll-15 [Amphiura filiformis]|uniref:probable tubulin polyglutamylase ttll-15 n=1 Tax=Amphiura filiformis TaxID=82378 RepID=UPI003B20C5EC
MVWMLRLMILVQVLSVTFLLCLTYLDKQDGNQCAPMCSKRENISDLYGIVNSRPVVHFYRRKDSPLKHGFSLTHIRNVLKMLGFVNQVSEDGTQWDVLWAHETPFAYGNLTNEVQQNQKVSQVPGMHTITHKALLTTQGRLKYVPKSFLIPWNTPHFLEKLKQNKDINRLWMQKNINHRGNQVKKTERA